jgi:uncharacterized protein DUF4443
MHLHIKTLANIATRYAPSRVLSFELVHIFKALQLMEKKGHVSRALLCRELFLGEGAIKTLVKHLRIQGLIVSTNAGTILTKKGKDIFSELFRSIPSEIAIPKCSIALGTFNYVVLLKGYNSAIKSGIEQRDAAIKAGALGATTLLFEDSKFVMPIVPILSKDLNNNPLQNEPKIQRFLIEKLKPEKNDVIIIGSSNKNKMGAEFAAKNAALITIMNHKRHNNNEQCLPNT